MAEWPCCHDPLRFSPASLRFVPPPPFPFNFPPKLGEATHRTLCIFTPSPSLRTAFECREPCVGMPRLCRTSSPCFASLGIAPHSFKAFRESEATGGFGCLVMAWAAWRQYPGSMPAVFWKLVGSLLVGCAQHFFKCRQNCSNLVKNPFLLKAFREPGAIGRP